MARVAATIEAELDALLAARALGESRVSYDGKTIEYRSVADMERAIASLRAELAAANGTLRRKIHLTDAPRQKGWST